MTSPTPLFGMMESSYSTSTTLTMASHTSTRKRTTSLSASEPVDKHNLPPKRPHRKSLTHDVDPPLANTRLSTLIYILVGLTTLLTAYFSYRTVQYKSKEQYSGWLSFIIHAFRRDAPDQTHTKVAAQNPSSYSDNIESHIVALASALGIPTHELASAIAGAVRSYVPPASLSSIKAHESGEAVSVLLQDPTPAANERGARKSSSTVTGVVEEFVEGVESFVGMDEP